MKRVLVIDDNLVAQEIISDWLIDTFKTDILLASNVNEAFLLLENNTVNLIVCDYEMPDGNGEDVLKYLKNNMLNMPMILFSGRYDLSLATQFPLVGVITDKSFERLFKTIQNYQAELKCDT